MRNGGGAGGGRGMSSHSGGRGMSTHRGGGSSGGRSGGLGGSGGRSGGMGSPGGRSGGMGGPGSGMGGPGGGMGPGMGAPRRRRSSGSGFGTGFLMGSLLSGGRRNRRVEDNGGPTGGSGGGGCLGGMMFPLLIVIILLVVVIASCSVMNMGGSGYDDYGVAYEGSDINREKLSASQCKESSHWIDDPDGWLSNQSKVKNAMDSFYKDTGVQPYLILTDNIDGKGEDVTDEEVESYLQNVYDSLYSDEGHMILLFVEFSYNDYFCSIYTGTAADGVIDSSAKDYIYNLIDAYYTDDTLTNDEYFEKIFTTAGENLMQDFNESTHTRNIIIIIVVIGVILIIVLILVRRASESRAREAAHTKEILDTPIGNSSSDEELLHKYGEDSDEDGPGGGNGPDNG